VSISYDAFTLVWYTNYILSTRAIALPCTACGKTFSDPSSVMRHFNEQHAEADHPCPVLGCGKMYVNHVVISPLHPTDHTAFTREKRRERLEKHLVKEHSYAKTDLPELPRKTRSKSTSSKQTTSIYSSGSPFSSAPPSNAPSPSYYRATSPPLVRVASPISYLSQTPRSSTPIWNDLPPVHDVYLSKIDTSYLQPESYRRLSPSSNFSESPASSGGAYLPSLSPSPPMPHYYSSNSNSYTSSSPSQFNAQQDFAQPFYTGAPLFRSF
jgi:hypothetical protein